MTDPVGSGVVSVDQMLANAKAAAASGGKGKLSKVQQLLQGRENPEDTVELSPVQKLTQQRETAEKKESYFDSDEFLRLKVQQLQAQLATYGSIPGLDPSGSVMAGIEAEIKAIISQQAEKLQKLNADAAEKQAERAKQQAEEASAALSPEEMLKRASNSLKGIKEPLPLSKEAQALLDKVKGTTVNTSS